jgi:hypothetical protein
MKPQAKQEDSKHMIACIHAACPAVVMMELKIPSVCFCVQSPNGHYWAGAKSFYMEPIASRQQEIISVSGFIGSCMQESFQADEPIHPKDLLCLFTRPVPAVCSLMGWDWLARASHTRLDRCFQETFEVLLANWDIVSKTAGILKKKRFHFLECVPGGKC